ncbi:DNA-directed RNA polymerase subunit beta [Chloroflexota bacterium]|nr:DNA-directed RNA polymerase subunit beta [Chloroflexota bacterium]
MSTVPSSPYARLNHDFPLPEMIEVQLSSFEWLKQDGLRDLFDEISPIESF